MKWPALLVLLTATLLITVTDGYAQSPGAASTAGKTSGEDGAGAIRTAIDVAELWQAGRTDAEIAGRLSAQQGYDRQEAVRKGLSDEQVIRQLIAKPATPTPGKADPGASAQHRASGDAYAKESRYDKAAGEYTQGIESSGDGQELRLRRAEAYRRYLESALNPAIRSKPEPSKREALEKSRALLCQALYSDYEAAARIGRQGNPDSYAELKAMQANLGRSAPSDQENEQIPLYYKRAARNIQGTRQMQPKYYEAMKKQSRSGFTMEQAMPGYRMACETAAPSAD